MRLILLGCPGAGKGTQAKFISEQYNIPHISTGNIFRHAIQQGSILGHKIKAIVESGQLVPDEFVIDLVKERLSMPDSLKGFLLDGFPRTIEQAEALNDFTDIDAVVEIDVSDKEIIRRMTGRRIHPGSGRTYHIIYQPPLVEGLDDITKEPLIQREDDMEATVMKRLNIYHTQTKPLREYYATNKNRLGLPHLIKVNGHASIEEIKTEIFSKLDELFNPTEKKE